MTDAIISRSVAGEQGDDYDDSRRGACVEAINKQSQNKGCEEIDAAFPMPDITILGESKGLLIEKLSVTDEAAQKYQELCTTTEGGRKYSGVSAVMDCQNDYHPHNLTVIYVVQNHGACYPAVPECEAYYKDSQGALDWFLDIQSIFENRCTVRLDTIDQLPSDESILGLPEKDSEDYEKLLPTGEAVFQSFKDVNFSASRVKKCLDAFGAAMHLFDDDDEDDPVEVARQEYKGRLQTTTIQATPVLVQLVHYDHDSDLASLGEIDQIVRNYGDRCQESGGHFSSFTGVLDCISTSDASQKTTTKVENEFTCFPAQGCEDYTTLLQWKLDTQRKYGMSCILRDGTGKTEAIHVSSGVGAPITRVSVVNNVPESALIAAALVAIAVGFVGFSYYRRATIKSYDRVRPDVENRRASEAYSDEDGKEQEVELSIII